MPKRKHETTPPHEKDDESEEQESDPHESDEEYVPPVDEKGQVVEEEESSDGGSDEEEEEEKEDEKEEKEEVDLLLSSRLTELEMRMKEQEYRDSLREEAQVMVTKAIAEENKVDESKRVLLFDKMSICPRFITHIKHMKYRWEVLTQFFDRECGPNSGGLVPLEISADFSTSRFFYDFRIDLSAEAVEDMTKRARESHRPCILFAVRISPRGQPYLPSHANTIVLSSTLTDGKYDLFWYEPHGRDRLVGYGVGPLLPNNVRFVPTSLQPGCQVVEHQSTYFDKFVILGWQGNCVIWSTLFAVAVQRRLDARGSVSSVQECVQEVEEGLRRWTPDICAIFIQMYTTHIVETLKLNEDDLTGRITIKMSKRTKERRNRYLNDTIAIETLRPLDKMPKIVPRGPRGASPPPPPSSPIVSDPHAPHQGCLQRKRQPNHVYVLVSLCLTEGDKRTSGQSVDCSASLVENDPSQPTVRTILRVTNEKHHVGSIDWKENVIVSGQFVFPLVLSLDTPLSDLLMTLKSKSIKKREDGLLTFDTKEATRLEFHVYPSAQRVRGSHIPHITIRMPNPNYVFTQNMPRSEQLMLKPKLLARVAKRQPLVRVNRPLWQSRLQTAQRAADFRPLALDEKKGYVIRYENIPAHKRHSRTRVTHEFDLQPNARLQTVQDMVHHLTHLIGSLYDDQKLTRLPLHWLWCPASDKKGPLREVRITIEPKTFSDLMKAEAELLSSWRRNKGRRESYAKKKQRVDPD